MFEIRALTEKEIEALSFISDSSANVAMTGTDGVEYYADNTGDGNPQFVADEDGDYIPV